MRKLLILSCCLILFVVAGAFTARLILAEECSPSCSNEDECKRKIDECSKLLQMSIQATKPHEEKAAELERNINAIEANVKTLSGQVEAKKSAISTNEERLSGRQTVLESQVRDFYKRDYQTNWEYLLTILFSGRNINEKVSVLAYRQSLINGEKRAITGLAVEIFDLANAKKKLEETQDWLKGRKAGLEITLAPIKKLVLGAKSYQDQLNQTVGALSAKQQELLTAKTGTFQTSVGEIPSSLVPCSGPPGSPVYCDPGFSPAFGGFSFGAPHRKGLSQYGAFGRAKLGGDVGQAENILHAYYGGIEIKKDYSKSISIHVKDGGVDWTGNIEDYVKRIYEAPNDWGDKGGYEALKAQAVAARSYALAYTNNGAGTICASESCQVFQTGAKGGNWERAANDTAGWVLVKDGQPFSAWYASTAGGYTISYTASGYTTPGEWDTKCGNQGCWQTGDAYEVIGGSPWFYMGWYKDRAGATCGRSNPWLNQDDFADIINAVIVYSSGGDTSGIYPLDYNSCFGGSANIWSKDQLAGEADKHGGRITSVSSTTVTYGTDGYTNKVTLGTNRGDVSFDGTAFRTAFNLRAPGKIYLASGLFNLEKK